MDPWPLNLVLQGTGKHKAEEEEEGEEGEEGEEEEETKQQKEEDEEGEDKGTSRISTNPVQIRRQIHLFRVLDKLLNPKLQKDAKGLQNGVPGASRSTQ